MIEREKCGFKDCLHIGEPGCVVNGDWERYPYYLQLLDEIRIREEFQLRTFGTKREDDVRYCLDSSRTVWYLRLVNSSMMLLICDTLTQVQGGRHGCETS